jgi:hypothetical protein
LFKLRRAKIGRLGILWWLCKVINGRIPNVGDGGGEPTYSSELWSITKDGRRKKMI